MVMGAALQAMRNAPWLVRIGIALVAGRVTVALVSNYS
jgi:hypothetical protein